MTDKIQEWRMQCMNNEIQDWRRMYFDRNRELNNIIDKQQDIILGLRRQNESLKRVNFNLRKAKRRK